MSGRLPQAPGQYQQSNESQTRATIERWDGENWKKGRDIELARGERLILRSPNGSRFALTVDNAGALSTTAL